MKKIILCGLLLVTGLVSAQDIQPKLEAQGKYVKATYFHDNGQVQQTGYFLNGKPDGLWVSFDASGKKVAAGEYTDGKKAGQWLFWNDVALTEVHYTDSRVALVKNWKQDAVVNRN